MIPLTDNTLTTHEKTFSGKFATDVNTIFYDEDPSSSMLIYKEWNLEKVIKDANKLYRRKLIDASERDLIISECTKWSKVSKDRPEYLKLTPEIVRLRELSEKIDSRLKDENVILNHNLNYLFNSRVVSKETFMVTRKFPKGKRVIILSATPDIVTVTKIAELSGKTVKVFKQSKQIKRSGKIEQYLVNSSKSKIEDNSSIIKDMNKAGTVITYKSMVGTYNTDEKVPYGGNISGYNSLKGKDLCVAYTLQAKPEYYRMKYSLLYETQPPYNKTAWKKVTWGKSKFMFYTSTNAELRDIIFQHIDSEMIQAIERARTLTENCTVTVFSNFVCSIVDPVNVKRIN